MLGALLLSVLSNVRRHTHAPVSSLDTRGSEESSRIMASSSRLARHPSAKGLSADWMCGSEHETRIRRRAIFFDEVF
eukprot:6186707-Pleurochrysis_carterae.AAC.3